MLTLEFWFEDREAIAEVDWWRETDEYDYEVLDCYWYDDQGNPVDLDEATLEEYRDCIEKELHSYLITPNR
jgi:hypothetical protein